MATALVNWDQIITKGIATDNGGFVLYMTNWNAASAFDIEIALYD